jgi:hypothetical protein
MVDGSGRWERRTGGPTDRAASGDVGQVQGANSDVGAGQRVVAAVRSWISRHQNAVLLAVSLLAIVMAIYSGLRGQAYDRCQASVNEAQAIASKARAEAAAQDRAADRAESIATYTLIREVFTVKGREEILAAYRKYESTVDQVNAGRAQADQQRQQNPLPPLPSATCG